MRKSILFLSLLLCFSCKKDGNKNTIQSFDDIQTGDLFKRDVNDDFVLRIEIRDTAICILYEVPGGLQYSCFDIEDVTETATETKIMLWDDYLRGLDDIYLISATMTFDCKIFEIKINSVERFWIDIAASDAEYHTAGLDEDRLIFHSELFDGCYEVF